MTQVCTNFLRLPSREDAFSSKRYAEKESRGVPIKGGKEGGYWEEMKSNSEQELRMKNCVSDGLRRRPVECNRAGG